MERKQKGILLTVFGVVLFFISFFLLLPIQALYIVSLVFMFIAVVLIGLGSAMALGFDRSLDVSPQTCYYCNGDGEITGVDGKETCPRCGGTGLARENDS